MDGIYSQARISWVNDGSEGGECKYYVCPEKMQSSHIEKIDTQQKNTHVSTLFYLYICQWDESK